MKIDDPIAFLPGVHATDAGAAAWLRQVMLRLRREVCWLWRERAAQAGTDAPPADAALPPFVHPALAALDFARYADDKQAFFRTDVTAMHLSRLIGEAVPADADVRRGGFGWAVRELALAPAETLVLALALLPAVDGAAGAVIACCLNDAQRSEPSLALAQRLWDLPDELLVCGDPAHGLVRHGLIEATSGWHAALRVPAIVARELLHPQQGLPPSLRAVPDTPVRYVREPAQTDSRRIVPVVGPAGAPLARVAAQDAARIGRALIEPVAACSSEQLLALATVAWLRGDALYLPPGTLKSERDADAHAAAPGLPILQIALYLGMHDRNALRHLPPDALPAIEVPPASYAERLAAWQRALPALAEAPVLAEVAQRLRTEASTIARLGAELRRADDVPTADRILQAARAQLDLGGLAQRVEPRFSIAELMLPPSQTRQMQEIVTAMRNLGRVHHQWGTARVWSESGLAALFAGPPGTGKTMACEALAQALDLPLWRIDLSQVVNKYVGETEKHLKQLFDGADQCEAILFFDEADALFGKRTEVRDAHDRYANLEVSYLLERMERFKGLAVLATNRRKDLDEAFMRRLRFVLEFPLPGAEERERIWRGVVPDGVDATHLDIAFLARRFALAGGHIRAIVFQACLQSAAEGAPRRLTMGSVIRAVQREYEKLERAASLDQYGPYAALVAAEKVMR
jgi:hypothetical protein